MLPINDIEIIDASRLKFLATAKSSVNDTFNEIIKNYILIRDFVALEKTLHLMNSNFPKNNSGGMVIEIDEKTLDVVNSIYSKEDERMLLVLFEKYFLIECDLVNDDNNKLVISLSYDKVIEKYDNVALTNLLLISNEAYKKAALTGSGGETPFEETILIGSTPKMSLNHLNSLASVDSFDDLMSRRGAQFFANVLWCFFRNPLSEKSELFMVKSNELAVKYNFNFNDVFKVSYLPNIVTDDEIECKLQFLFINEVLGKSNEMDHFFKDGHRERVSVEVRSTTDKIYLNKTLKNVNKIAQSCKV